MGYVVIEHFCDMQDNGRGYAVGETFPRTGLAVSESRLNELATIRNALGRPLIKLDTQVAELVDKIEPEGQEESPAPTPAPKSRGRKKKE